MGPLLIAAAAASVLGGAMQTWKGAKEQEIAGQNAATAELNAKYARLSADDNAYRIRYAKRLAIGQAQAGYTKGVGVNPYSGSAADVSTEIGNQYELDALKAEIEGNVAVAAGQRAADLYRKQGQAAMIQGFIGATTSVGMGALNIAGSPSGFGSLKGPGFGTAYVPNIPIGMGEY